MHKLVEAGFKEIVLTGIHIASYGKDQGQIRLSDLIRMIHDVEGIRRIRLGSVEPTMITDEFTAEAARLESSPLITISRCRAAAMRLWRE